MEAENSYVVSHTLVDTVLTADAHHSCIQLRIHIECVGQTIWQPLKEAQTSPFQCLDLLSIDQAARVTLERLCDSKSPAPFEGNPESSPSAHALCSQG